MKKTTNLILYMLFFVIITSFSVTHANATPSSNLRVLVMDPEGDGLGGGGDVFSVNPNDDFTFSITDELLDSAERIAVHNGDVYVANVDRVSRIDLNAAGQPDPDALNNLQDVTAGDFILLTGIAFDSSGLIYVADSDDNTISKIDPSGTLPATPTLLSFTPSIAGMRDIAIDNDILYVLDIDGDGAIFTIDLSSPSTADLVYSGGVDGDALSGASTLVVRGDDVFVAGLFDSGPGILKITLSTSSAPVVTELFDNSSEILLFPFGLVIDNVGNDLYITDGTTLYSIDLDTPGDLPQEVVTSGLFVAPTGLALLEVSGTTTTTSVSVVKTVNATVATPGDALLYTITVTNLGPGPAASLKITDNFPNNGADIVQSYAPGGQLSFTSEIHDDSAGTTTDQGVCDRVGGDPLEVLCEGYDTLDVGDFVVVTLEGIVNQFAVNSLINTVVIDYVGGNNQTTATTPVDPSITFSITKIASTNSVLAGVDSITYTITVVNPGSTANDVTITDTLPNGISIDVGTIPSGCSVTDNPDGSSTLECSSITILSNGGTHTITYSADIGSDATDPLVNSVTVTCPTCAPGQTASTTTTVTRESDLFLEKSADTTEVTAGQDSILYTISVTNNGPSDAANVVITDTLPDGITLSTVSGCDSYDLQDNVLTCSILSITSGASAEININVDVSSGAVGPLENTASVSSDSFDPELGDNSDDSDPIDVIQLADVTVRKTGPATTVAGRIITYEFAVTNIGPSDAENVLLSDELPEDFVLIPSTEPGSLTDPMCTDQLGTVECQFGTVGAGQTITKLIQVQIGLDVTGNIQNTATVETSTEESDSDNNISTITTLVEPPFCGKAEDDFDEIIFGTEGNDNIHGTNGDDLIFGLGGNDKIQGKDGDDCIFGGDGNDKIHGGKGNDTIEGNAGNDYIHGQQGNDTLIGGDGDDKLWGGKGNDIIEGNAGNDKIHGQQENDTLTGGDGNDKIYGGKGNDVIDAGSGDDRVHAHQGNDVVTGGDGNDWLGAGNGNDEVSGGLGNDKIFGRQGNDIINGDDGDDYIHGGQGNDTVNGGDGNDKIFGHQGHDILNGNDNDDYIHGGQGNDNIDGGDGYDKCNGAQGNNTIINCEVEDKKMKEEHEEDDDDEGESEDEDDDDDNDHHDDDKDKKEKKDKDD